jgi:hypothetical protein
MSARAPVRALGCAAAALALVGCVAPRPYDYTNYRQHPPRSILVLPPLNESTAVEATYGYLSTVTRPLAELGYYVFPVMVVDQFLRENGLPGAGEMHQVPLDRVAEVIGADAVLFITVEEYGTKYQLVNSATVVRARARLVDTRTGLLLWEGRRAVRQDSNAGSGGGSGGLLANLVAAALAQAIGTSIDAAHGLSRSANLVLFTTRDHGLLYGPYHPQHDRVP